MIEIPHKTSATIAFARAEATPFYQLPGLIGGVLNQSGAKVTALDLGLRGDSIRYATNYGEVTLLSRVGQNGARQVAVTCDSIAHGTRTIGRQLCFQIVRRMIGRLAVSSVFWQPTRQRMSPETFTWENLADRVQRWRVSSVEIGFKNSRREADSSMFIGVLHPEREAR